MIGNLHFYGPAITHHIFINTVVDDFFDKHINTIIVS
jgi:hypothetical protein